MRHKNLLYLIIYGTFLLPAARGRAQQPFSDNYNATFISMNEGLPHNFIDDIYKDSRGFLWISMEGGGLSRYDGYEFVNFNLESASHSLKSNFVSNVAEDRFGRLWVASEGGIDIINLHDRQPVPLLRSNPLTDSLATRKTLLVMCDATGCVWICNDRDIRRIRFDAQGNIDKVHFIENVSKDERHIVLKDLDNNGRPWLGMNGQLSQISLNVQDELQAVSIVNPSPFPAGTYFCDFVKKENEVWIATNNGLFRYNRQKNAMKCYKHDQKDKGSLSQDLVTALALTNDRQLIAASLKGLNIYDPLGDNFERIESDPQDDGDSLLNSNFINCIMVDENHIWIGTESGGIDKLTLKRLSMHIYRHNRKDPRSISPNPVNAIFEDTGHVLWVGSVEGGLNRKNPNDDTFIHYTSEDGILSHNSVSALAADGQGRLWVGTWGGGITLLDRKNPVRRLEVISQASDSLSPPIDFVGALIYDSINNGVWIGANQGICFYDIRQKKTYSPLAGCDAKGCIGSTIDKDGNLWMGSMEGVYIINLRKRRETASGPAFAYRHLKYKLDNPASKVVEKITCFFPASDGTLWLGSNGYGIYKRLTDGNGGERFVAYTTRQGLSNNTVRSILEDSDGCLWIATNLGLSRFSPAEESFTNYNRQDGLTNVQFYWNAACRTSDNLLYFGNMKGMIAVNSNLSTGTAHPYTIRFTRLCVENEEVPAGSKLLPQDIAVTERIRIHERKQSFSVEFSSLNFDSDNNGFYRYRLDGFDKKWTRVPAGRNMAAYTNLSPGTYTLYVEYAVPGKESVPGRAELEIEIVPYFYKTAWFIILMIALLAAGVWQIYRIRIRNLERRSALLLRKVEQRTCELNQQKLLLEEQTEKLSRQNRTLEQQNEKITRQKEQLTMNKIRELTFDRIAFFTDITHEFRTPITLIIGPIERALKLSHDPQVIEQLHFVERSAKYLLSLVNQLMDFRKVESGKMEIVRHRHHFIRFINELLTPFAVLAGERNIRVRQLTRIGTPEFSYDEEALNKVLGNLLSNAIKFTPDGGRISLYAAILRNRKEKEAPYLLYICVSDTGNGFPPGDIDKVFDRFFQSQGQISFPMYGQSGSGIGLYLCRRIIQMHGGEIHARNNKRTGASFRILLPLTEKDMEARTEPSVSVAELPTPASPHEAATGNRKSGIRILVVEDNPDMRGFIRSILEEKYEVSGASNGEEALRILGSRKIDFIICDLMMPNPDGIELARRIRQDTATAHIPFLMLTAKNSQKARTESYGAGVDGYLLKPFNEDLLITRIENILGNRRRNRHQYAITPDLNSLGIQAENGDKSLINHAMGVMKDNYMNPQFDVDDFCNAMGSSRTRLNQKLRTLIGMPVSQLIRLYRLRLAREIIVAQKGKGKNVTDIAYEVGFNDPKYFSRCFQKEYGIKPSSLMSQINSGNDSIQVFDNGDNGKKDVPASDG